MGVRFWWRLTHRSALATPVGSPPETVSLHALSHTKAATAREASAGAPSPRPSVRLVRSREAGERGGTEVPSALAPQAARRLRRRQAEVSGPARTARVRAAGERRGNLRPPT